MPSLADTIRLAESCCPRFVFCLPAPFLSSCVSLLAAHGLVIVVSLPSRDRVQWAGRGRTVHCARAVKKVGFLCPDKWPKCRPRGQICTKSTNHSRPIFPDGQGDRGNYCVPMRRTAPILTQSKNSDNELKQTMFHTENASLLSESAVFVLWRWGVGDSP